MNIRKVIAGFALVASLGLTAFGVGAGCAAGEPAPPPPPPLPPG